MHSSRSWNLARWSCRQLKMEIQSVCLSIRTLITRWRRQCGVDILPVDCFMMTPLLVAPILSGKGSICHVVGMGNVCAGRGCSSTWHNQQVRSNASERVRCSNGGPKRTAPRVRGCTCRHMHDPRIVADWLAATEHVKHINQAWFTARAFARIFATHTQCDVSEVMCSTRHVHFETLRRARIRLDAVASLLWREWWRDILDSSISIFLYVGSSPQSRGEEMFASSFEIWDQRLPWSRELMPVLGLERRMLDARPSSLGCAQREAEVGQEAVQAKSDPFQREHTTDATKTTVTHLLSRSQRGATT